MHTLLFAYLGPETLLPMTSVVAAAVGFAAMFGRNVFVLASRIFRTLVRFPQRFTKSSPTTLPRLARQDQRQGEWRGHLSPQGEVHVEKAPKGTHSTHASR